MSRRLTGGRACPLAGPLASSHAARNPRAGGLIWRVAPMTLSVPPCFSLLLSLAPPGSLSWLLPASCGGDSGGGL